MHICNILLIFITFFSEIYCLNYYIHNPRSTSIDVTDNKEKLDMAKKKQFILLFT